jgi:hypothetical protein
MKTCLIIIFVRFGFSVADVMFLQGPLANISIFCSAITVFIGPRYDPNAQNVVATVAPLYIFRGIDPCEIDSIDANDIRDKAVFVENYGSCLDEVTYENFVEKGAKVLIRKCFLPAILPLLTVLGSSIYFPGNDAYM